MSKFLQAQFSVSGEWTWSAWTKALHCLLYIPVILATAEGKVLKACLSPRQHSLVNSQPSPAIQELWLFSVAAFLCQADLLLGETDDSHLLRGSNQLQLLIPSDFNESMNIDNSYLSIIGWGSRRATGHEIIVLSLILKGLSVDLKYF